MNPSDLDTLADYVEGLLDGTPEAEEVAGRIATDPTWADAYQQLTAATPQVTTALSELADPPLPPDVAARLDDAMKKQRVKSRMRGEPAPKRSWGQVGGWAAAAVIVLVICLGGIAAIRSGGSSNSDSASSTGASQSAGEVAADGVHKSGLPYTSTALGPQARRLVEPGTFAGQANGTASANVPAPAAAPSGPLSRLTDTSALHACLVTLGVTEADAVDYATLDGRPAVVVVTRDPSGTAWDVLAAGADCGVDGQSHLLQRTTVPK